MDAFLRHDLFLVVCGVLCSQVRAFWLCDGLSDGPENGFLSI